jgi:hypothetical protein
MCHCGLDPQSPVIFRGSRVKRGMTVRENPPNPRNPRSKKSLYLCEIVFFYGIGFFQACSGTDSHKNKQPNIVVTLYKTTKISKYYEDKV